MWDQCYLVIPWLYQKKEYQISITTTNWVEDLGLQKLCLWKARGDVRENCSVDFLTHSTLGFYVFN